MNPRKKNLALALMAAITAMGTFASTCFAFDQRSSFAACVDATASGKLVNGANNSTTNSVVLACDVLDTASLPHASMSTINLYYEDLSPAAINASRCVSYQNTTGGACGDIVSSVGTGTSFITPPVTPATFQAHWNFGHFVYLNVVLPPRTASGASGIKGFWMSN